MRRQCDQQQCQQLRRQQQQCRGHLAEQHQCRECGREQHQLSRRTQHGAARDCRVADVSRLAGHTASDLPALRQGPQDRHLHQEQFIPGKRKGVLTPSIITNYLRFDRPSSSIRTPTRPSMPSRCWTGRTSTTAAARCELTTAS